MSCNASFRSKQSSYQRRHILSWAQEASGSNPDAPTITFLSCYLAAFRLSADISARRDSPFQIVLTF
jgi:hypothetical protein